MEFCTVTMSLRGFFHLDTQNWIVSMVLPYSWKFLPGEPHALMGDSALTMPD